jgi:hypothetical protein
MANVFSIQFEVIPKKDEIGSVVFDAMHQQVKNWVIDKYSWHWKIACGFPEHGETLTPLVNHSVHGSIVHVPDGQLERVRWVHPADQDESLSWSTDIVIARLRERVQFALRLDVASSQYVVRPAWAPLGRPRVVTQILRQFPCWVGPQPLLANKQEILAPDVDAFVREFLLNEKRTLPIVVVSHDRFGDRPVIDADRIQQTLMGFAQVVVLDKWAAFRLTDLLTKPLSCYNGAVRVYWPGLRLSSNPLDHPLYLPDALQKHEFSGKPLDKRLFNFFAKVSAFRYVDGDVIREVQHEIDAARKSEVDKSRLQLQRALADAGTVPELKAEVDRLWGELDRSWNEAEELRTRVADLEGENERLKGNWAIYQEHQATGPDEEPPVAEDTADLEFNSVGEALAAAKRDFGTDLLIYDSAQRSAEASDFARPQEVYRALMAVRDIGNLYHEAKRTGNSMGSWDGQFKSRGFTQYSPDESQTTKTQYGKQRKFTDNGKTRSIFRHLDLGGGDRKNCLQIYFEPDDGSKRTIIAYCGVHLPIASQRT